MEQLFVFLKKGDIGPSLVIKPLKIPIQRSAKQQEVNV
jgi:hypothetical protein